MRVGTQMHISSEIKGQIVVLTLEEILIYKFRGKKPIRSKWENSDVHPSEIFLWFVHCLPYFFA